MAETAGAICGECRSMEGLVCVVTGATSGIGREIALGLARAGARVLGVGRSAERAALAEREIGRDAGRGEVRFTAADLSLQSSVAALAREAATRWGRVDVLVNNAGTFAARRALTPDGVELQLAVNYIAPFLLTRELLPHLAREPDGRVLSLSSG